MTLNYGFYRIIKSIFLLIFLIFSGLLYAQTDDAPFIGFPYLSLDGGVGTSSVLVDGLSFNLLLVPKLSLTHEFMIGSKNLLHISTDDIIALETQGFFRWNFLTLKSLSNTAFFVQGGIGFLGAFKGNDVRDSRASLVFDATIGATIPLSSRWHIEPSIRGGFPFIAGADITVGYKFPLPKGKTQVISANEIIRRIVITQVEYIIFAPDIARFNYGVDHDAQSLNELVMNHTAQILKENSDLRVRIEGHANPVTHAPGEIEELIALSTSRANEVARQLRQRGVSESQIVVIGHGGTRIVADAADRVHWNMNRRVELIIIQVNTD
jgi:hypothetical protein